MPLPEILISPLILDAPALLRAISEKLIPGIPLKTRISSLQQTAVVEEATSQTDSNIHESSLSVLEEVIDKATSRSIIQKEIESKALPQITSWDLLLSILCI